MKTEISKLDLYLNTVEIPHEIVPHLLDGSPHLYYPKADNWLISVICSEFSKGGEIGLLEIFAKPEEDTLGYLTARQVLEIILQDYNQSGGRPYVES